MGEINKMSDEQFEVTDSGAALTQPVQIGSLRVGHIMCIDNFPCKIIEMSTAKTGKHGSAKASIRAQNIFTGKMKEFIGPTGHNADVPFVVNKEYVIINVEEEDVACVDPEGLEVNGVVLPIHDGDLAKKIKVAWDKLQESGEEKELIILVTHAMGEFHITSMKERNL